MNEVHFGCQKRGNATKFIFINKVNFSAPIHHSIQLHLITLLRFYLFNFFFVCVWTAREQMGCLDILQRLWTVSRAFEVVVVQRSLASTVNIHPCEYNLLDLINVW